MMMKLAAGAGKVEGTRERAVQIYIKCLLSAAACSRVHSHECRVDIARSLALSLSLSLSLSLLLSAHKRYTECSLSKELSRVMVPCAQRKAVTARCPDLHRSELQLSAVQICISCLLCSVACSGVQHELT